MVDGSEHAAPATADEVAQLRQENEVLRTRLDRRTRLRRWASIALVVLASIGVLASVVTAWAHEVVLDTDAFMDTVEPALDDPAFYETMSGYVSDQALVALDLEARVTDALGRLDAFLSGAIVEAIDPDPAVLELLSRFERPSLTALAPSISAALEGRVTERIDAFATSAEFQARVVELVRRAHEASVALVRDDLAELPNVYIADGEVRLNLIPLVTEALQPVLDSIRDFLPDVTLPAVVADGVDAAREQLAAALGAQLPEDFAQLTVMSEEALGDAQQAVQRFDRLVWLLVLLTVALVAAAIAVAPDRRRAVIHLGIGVVVALVLAMAAVRRVEGLVLDEITNPDGRLAATQLLGNVTTDLRGVTLAVAAVALVTGIAAYLAGDPPWLERLRASRSTGGGTPASDLDRWIASHFDALRIAGIGVALVVVYLTGIALIPVVLVGGALAVFLWAISAARDRVAPAVPDAAEAEATGVVAEHDAPLP